MKPIAAYTLAVALSTLAAPLQASLWPVLPDLEGVAGYNQLYFFKGRYINLSGQGPASFWSSTDGINFTAHPNRYFAQGQNGYVFDDLMLIHGFGSTLQSSTDGVNFTTDWESGLGGSSYRIVRDGGRYYAGTSEGLFVADGQPTGFTLAAGNADLSSTYGDASKVASFIAARDGRVIVSLAGGKPQLSTDGGASFQAALPGISETRADFFGEGGDYLWAQAGTSLYRATWDSLNWQRLADDFAGTMLGIGPDGGLYRSNRIIIPRAPAIWLLEKSIDGVNWGKVFDYSAHQEGTSMQSINFAGDMFYVSGTKTRVYHGKVDDLIAPGENLFKSAQPLLGDWYYSDYLGFCWMGSYPWIYTLPLGWMFISGPNESGFFAYSHAIGWFHTSATEYPRIASVHNLEHYDVDTTSLFPDTRFTRVRNGEVVTSSRVGELEFDFDALAGRTIRLSDSIGEHTLVVNSFGNEGDRGDLTMSIEGSTYTFSSVQLSYAPIAGQRPRILLQAQALPGDTSMGSTVQVGLHFQSQTSGTTSYVGYNLGIVPPVTGGSGVRGRFTVE
jgi:hypothetical protein